MLDMIKAFDFNHKSFRVSRLMMKEENIPIKSFFIQLNY